MRNNFFYLLAFLLISVSAKAQPIFMDETHTFYGALTAAASFAQIDGDNYAGYSKTGFIAGGGVYIRVVDNMAMSMEILYSQKGSLGKGTPNSTNGSFDIQSYKVNLNYAEVPFQLWYFDKHNHHFGGGFSYSQLINSTEESVTKPDQHINTDKYPFRKMDINLVLSANFRIWKGLYTGLRFNYSLLPIRKDANVPPGFGRAEQYNNVVALKFTYLFMQGSSYYKNQ